MRSILQVVLDNRVPRARILVVQELGNKSVIGVGAPVEQIVRKSDKGDRTESGSVL